MIRVANRKTGEVFEGVRCPELAKAMGVSDTYAYRIVVNREYDHLWRVLDDRKEPRIRKTANENNREFANRLKELFYQKGVTAKDVAKDLYVGESTIQNFTNATTLPKADMLKDLCVYLGCSADYLLGLEE